MSTRDVMKSEDNLVVSCANCGEKLFDTRLLVLDEYCCPFCGDGLSITVKNGNLNIRKIDIRSLKKGKGRNLAVYAGRVAASNQQDLPTK